MTVQNVIKNIRKMIAHVNDGYDDYTDAEVMDELHGALALAGWTKSEVDESLGSAFREYKDIMNFSSLMTEYEGR